MERAGFGLRLAAGAIDLAILLVIHTTVIAIARASPLLTGDMPPEWFFAGLAVVDLVLLLGYTSLEIFKGAALGKYLLKLRIAGEDGSLRRGRLRVRWAIKYSPLIALSLFLLPVILADLDDDTIVQFLGMASAAICILCFLLLGGFFQVLGGTRQALHDRICDTAVFRDAPSGARGFEVLAAVRDPRPRPPSPANERPVPTEGQD